MKVPENYYNDEVVGGFYVPSLMKKCWAAQVEIIEDIAAVCERHGIKYYADAGTLMGAVRHGGFIPWDDDTDLCMMREEYEKFLKVAHELPDNYTVVNWRTRDDWDDVFTRVVNTIGLDFDPKFMERYHGFPFSAGVDIFVNDYLYQDEQKEEEREELLKAAYELAKHARHETAGKKELIAAGERLSALSGYRFNKRGNLVYEFFGITEKLLSEVPREEAKEAVLMPAWLQFKSNKYKIEWFDEGVPMKFEHSKVMVPIHYDEILKNKYGNYVQASRIGGKHNYPYYTAQMEEVTKHTGWEPPIYKCEPTEPEISVGIRQEEENKKSALEQQVAQIENLMSSQANAALFAELQPQVDALKASLNAMAHGNNDVVFLPYNPDHWHRMSNMWEREMADPDSDVYVVPLPTYDMNLDGTTGTLHYAPEAFPPEVHTCTVEEYDLASRHPKRIYIQAPFDGYNPSMSVHPYFYSDELLKYTDELVYIPFFEVNEIVEGDEKGIYTLDQFVKMPGTVHADRILLDSEVMKQTYIDALCALCGKDSRSIWEERIEVVDDLFAVKDKEKSGMKSIFYYTDVCPFLAEGDVALDKLRRNLEIFKESKDDIRLIWHPFDDIEDYLKERVPEVYDQYMSIVNEFLDQGWGVYDKTADGESVLADCVAYYGDPSPYVYQAQLDKKPVMIADIHI
ncbi:MAG: LicD family protein [Lachnospiraceae bacterium]|nr:LicD family protein [Lachnospiraceae bacterium]